MQRRKEEEADAARDGGAEDEDDFDLSDSDGEDGGDDEGEDDEGRAGAPDLVGAAAERRAARAAGDDPLQVGLRTMTAQLLLKHGAQPTARSLRELQEEQEGGSGEEGSSDGEDSDEDSGSESGGEDGEAADEEGGGTGRGAPRNGSEGGGGSSGEGGEGGVDDSDAGSMDEEEQAEVAAQMDAVLQASGGAGAGEGGRGDDDGSSDDELLAMLKQAIAMKQAEQGPGSGAEVAAGAKSGKRAAREAEEGAERDAAGEEATLARVPEAPPVPGDAAELAEMARGLRGGAVGALVARIRSANAAVLNAEHRTGLQALYGVAMGHYAAVAAARPPQRAVLEGLVAPLAGMAAEVPLYAAMHARTHLRAMFDKAYAALEECALPSACAQHLRATSATAAGRGMPQTRCRACMSGAACRPLRRQRRLNPWPRGARRHRGAPGT